MKTKTTALVSGSALSWRGALIGIVMFCLILSLATRTFHLTNSQSVTVQSSAARGMRQHMNRDAVGFVPPVPVFSTFRAPTAYPYVAPAGPPLAVILLDESLYNRPPPSC
jgi:hypothetical protein